MILSIKLTATFACGLHGIELIKRRILIRNPCLSLFQGLGSCAMTTFRCCLLFKATILGIGLITSILNVVSAKEKIDRAILPIQRHHSKAITEADTRKAKGPSRFEIKAPKYEFNGKIGKVTVELK
jgi:hypothetical protein